MMSTVGPPYTSYSRALKLKYGRAAHRVCVDAGFSCPNRKGGSGPGCSYCAEDGGRAPYLGKSESSLDGPARIMQESEGLRKQIDGAVRFIRRRYGDGELILYFQAFSGTNAPAGVLKRVYDAALECAPFRELAVSTRPDCIDEEKADLLKSYLNPRRNVWVEMGLQSANDPTLRRISRGHTADDFLAAYRLLKERGIAVAVHLILGLPGETASDMENTARFVARLAPDGLKIHNLHIPRGTPLAEEYGKGEICAPAMERHLDYTILILERMPPETLIMRLTCDTPKNALCAPRHFADKHEFTARLAAEMRTRGTWQGRLDRAGAVGVDS